MNKELTNILVKLTWDLRGIGCVVIKTQNVPTGKVRTYRDKEGNTITITVRLAAPLYVTYLNALEVKSEKTH